MGAEAVRKLIQLLDFEGLNQELRAQVKTESSVQRKKTGAQASEDHRQLPAEQQRAELDDPGLPAGAAAGSASPGAPRWRPFRYQ